MAVIGVRDGGHGGSCPLPNSGSLSTDIRAESRHYSGKTHDMLTEKILPLPPPPTESGAENFCYYPPFGQNSVCPPPQMDVGPYAYDGS